jgi:hypothetical protein
MFARDSSMQRHHGGDMARRRSIWRYAGLFLTVLVVSGIWLLLDLAVPTPRPKGPEPASPSNPISNYILTRDSGPAVLAGLIEEKDWETACLIEEGVDPALAVESPITQTIIKSNEPLANRHYLKRLWKIAIIKGNVAAIYYFDNRQIRRTDSARCMPLRRAMLSFQSDTNPRAAGLYDKDSSID